MNLTQLEGFLAVVHERQPDQGRQQSETTWMDQAFR